MSRASTAFIAQVATQYGWSCQLADDVSYLRGTLRSHPALAWECQLREGNPNLEEQPAIVWRCAALALRAADIDRAMQVLRKGQHAAGSLLTPTVSASWQVGAGKGLLAKLVAAVADQTSLELEDPYHLIDDALAQRLRFWPSSRAATGEVKLGYIRTDTTGLVVASTSWWNDPTALAHQIDLAIELADRLADCRAANGVG